MFRDEPQEEAKAAGEGSTRLSVLREIECLNRRAVAFGAALSKDPSNETVSQASALLEHQLQFYLKIALCFAAQPVPGAAQLVLARAYFSKVEPPKQSLWDRFLGLFGRDNRVRRVPVGNIQHRMLDLDPEDPLTALTL